MQCGASRRHSSVIQRATISGRFQFIEKLRAAAAFLGGGGGSGGGGSGGGGNILSQKRRFYGRPISGYLMAAAALDVRLKGAIARGPDPTETRCWIHTGPIGRIYLLIYSLIYLFICVYFDLFIWRLIYWGCRFVIFSAR